jgi:uracil-DNA glycosylase
MPTLHPAYLLRNKQNTELFWLVWDDMVKVLERLDLPVPDVQRKSR